MQSHASCLLSFIAVIFLPQNCILLNSIKLESCRSHFNENLYNSNSHSNYTPRQFITLLMHQIIQHIKYGNHSYDICGLILLHLFPSNRSCKLILK